MYTDHILIKIVYAPFPPLETAFSLCNSCENGRARANQLRSLQFNVN